ncbi:hypothetical protein [Polynucleobacter antarcticus]|nr:hypothetical protein [Polynucleobacter antarcticus]
MKKLLSMLIATSLGFAPLANACTSFLLSGNDGGLSMAARWSLVFH